MYDKYTNYFKTVLIYKVRQIDADTIVMVVIKINFHQQINHTYKNVEFISELTYTID